MASLLAWNMQIWDLKLQQDICLDSRFNFTFVSKGACWLSSMSDYEGCNKMAFL